MFPPLLVTWFAPSRSLFLLDLDMTLLRQIADPLPPDLILRQLFFLVGALLRL